MRRTPRKPLQLMLRQLVSILLICCVLGSLFQIAIPLTWYVSNYQHVSTELCINRNNPNIDCNGMCQLNNKIQKGQNHQDDQPKPLVDRNHRIDFFFSNGIAFAAGVANDAQRFVQLHPQHFSLWISEPPSPPPQIG